MFYVKQDRCYFDPLSLDYIIYYTCIITSVGAKYKSLEVLPNSEHIIVPIANVQCLGNKQATGRMNHCDPPDRLPPLLLPCDGR